MNKLTILKLTERICTKPTVALIQQFSLSVLRGKVVSAYNKYVVRATYFYYEDIDRFMFQGESITDYASSIKPKSIYIIMLECDGKIIVYYYITRRNKRIK